MEAQVDLLEVNAGLIRIYEVLGKGGGLTLEELKPIEEKIRALEETLGRRPEPIDRGDTF